MEEYLYIGVERDLQEKPGTLVPTFESSIAGLSQLSKSRRWLELEIHETSHFLNGQSSLHSGIGGLVQVSQLRAAGHEADVIYCISPCIH